MNEEEEERCGGKFVNGEKDQLEVRWRYGGKT